MKKVLLTGVLALVMNFPLNAVSFKSTKIPEAKLKELVKETKLLNNPLLTVTRGVEYETVYHVEIDAKTPNGSKILEAFIDKQTGAIYIGGGYTKDGTKYSF